MITDEEFNLMKIVIRLLEKRVAELEKEKSFGYPMNTDARGKWIIPLTEPNYHLYTTI